MEFNVHIITSWFDHNDDASVYIIVNVGWAKFYERVMRVPKSKAQKLVLHLGLRVAAHHRGNNYSYVQFSRVFRNVPENYINLLFA